jgi:hypothetical protein
VKAKLRKAGIIELVGRENVFKSFSKAVATCRLLVEADPQMPRDRPVVLSESTASLPRMSQDRLTHTSDQRPDHDGS